MQLCRHETLCRKEAPLGRRPSVERRPPGFLRPSLGQILATCLPAARQLYHCSIVSRGAEPPQHRLPEGSIAAALAARRLYRRVTVSSRAVPLGRRSPCRRGAVGCLLRRRGALVRGAVPPRRRGPDGCTVAAPGSGGCAVASPSAWGLYCWGAGDPAATLPEYYRLWAAPPRGTIIRGLRRRPDGFTAVAPTAGRLCRRSAGYGQKYVSLKYVGQKYVSKST